MENIKFFEYLTTFSNLQGDEMPEPKNMLEATAEANNLASLSTKGRVPFSFPGTELELPELN